MNEELRKIKGCAVMLRRLLEAWEQTPDSSRLRGMSPVCEKEIWNEVRDTLGLPRKED